MDALFGDKFNRAGKLCNCPLGFWFNFKMQLHAETNRAQHAQGVFFKSVRRLPHRPDYFLINILDTAKQIHKTPIIWNLKFGVWNLFVICDLIFVIFAYGHRVNRKIPPLQILIQTVFKFYFIRMPSVRVALLTAVGGYLNAF